MANLTLARIAILLFGIGGAVIFSVSADAMNNIFRNNGFLPMPIDTLFSFIGFVVVGLGLYLIVQSGQPDSKQ